MIRLPLKFNIVLLTFGVAFIISAVTSVLYVLSLAEIEVKSLRSYEQFAEKTAYGVAAQFYERYGDVQAFATNAVFRQGNGKAMTDILMQYSKLYGIYDAILFVDQNGSLVAVTNRAVDDSALNVAALQKLDLKNSSWFQAVKNGQFTDDKNKGFVNTFFEDAKLIQLLLHYMASPCWGRLFRHV